MMALVPRLRRVRERQALTMRELAAQAGVALGTVYRLEHGKPAELPTVRKLAAALGVRPHELMAPEPDEGQHAAAA